MLFRFNGFKKSFITSFYVCLFKMDIRIWHDLWFGPKGPCRASNFFSCHKNHQKKYNISIKLKISNFPVSPKGNSQPPGLKIFAAVSVINFHANSFHSDFFLETLTDCDNFHKMHHK